ncbi:MAG: DNA translocase FtsK 4TM domain-containing protein [Eubacteriales bacterium]|nr:DNA translocase FtsK 4TM domain-containing protein [Eubacteriales bacterium]
MSNTTKNNAGAGQRAGGKKVSAPKASQKKKQTSFGKKKTEEKDRGIPMKNEVWVIASFGIMVILMLSNFGWCGTVGVWLSSFLYGIFGCAQYVMPVAFFLFVTALLANDFSVLAMKKCGAAFLTLTMLSSYVQIIYQGEVKNFYDLFATAVKDHMSGGMLGGGIALLLKQWFGTPGAIVIISCVMLLSLVVLTQRSFLQFFRERMEKGKALWKNGLKRLEKERQEKKEKEEKEKKEKISLADRIRAKKCEEKIKEIEEEQMQAAAGQRREGEGDKKEKTKKTGVKKQPEIKIHIPLFTDEQEVKRKDEVKELHPEVYPFTAEDGKPQEFDGKLDFSAFSFRSGKTPEEFEEEVKQTSFEEAVSEILRREREQEVVGEDEAPEEKEGGLPEEIVLSEKRTDTTFATDGEGDWNKEDWMKEEDAEEETGDVWPQKPEDTAVEVVLSEEEEVLSAVENPQSRKTKDEESASVTSASREEAVFETVKEEPERLGGVKKSTLQAQRKSEKQRKTEMAPGQQPNEEKETLKRPKSYETVEESRQYVFPPVNLLVYEKHTLAPDYDKHLKETAMKLQSTLESFGVHVTITDISCGPAVTRYEMFPEQGTKVSKIVSLTDDIKLNLAASDIRIEAPIPGKAAIGIEVPNKENQTVHFRELVDSRVFRSFKSKLAFAVGKDIGGKIVVADLAKMPHLLIAGATGSGKSVCINTLIMSILYKASPSEVKLMMIDPKMVELSTYNGIPHLLIPVVTDPKKASGALNWAVAEMTDRYKKFTECSVRNIEGYNKKVDSLLASGEVEEGKLEKMPQIVIIIDELADLMMVAPGEVEDAIVRLSQLARAAGIHLVIATQRPSVNVITGLIKANVPSRIAFSVSSGVDSRTIIDMNGAEKLLGRGDMLFYPSGYQKPVRVQGAFISDAEVSRVAEFLRENETMAVYDAEVSEKIENKIKNSSVSSERDEYFEAAARFIMEKDKATIGMLQRMFKIGFNRAARIIDQMAEAGIVGPEEGTKPRKILMTPEQLDAFFEEML